MMESQFHYVIHADLDAFYASVEQIDDRSLQGKPVVVGGPPESRGVVAAASYEARTFGVHSAMPMRTALRLCPELVRVSPRFDRYHQVSAQVMSIFRETTEIIEPLSLDEAFLDIGSQPSTDRVIQIAKVIKIRVQDDTKLAITVGGGTSKTVAKIASQLAKPDGLMVIDHRNKRDFLAPLDIEMMSGIGPKTSILLKEHGIVTLEDLSSADGAWLVKMLGRRAPELQGRAMGIDKSIVEPHRETKSVSAETTFIRDADTEGVLVEELRHLSEGISAKLKRSGLKGRTVTLKLRLSDFTTFTRQRSLQTAIDDAESILLIAHQLLKVELNPGRTFRLIGVGVKNFPVSQQLSLLTS